MENMRLQGVLELKFYKNGELVHSESAHNLVVDSGYNALFAGLSGIANKHIVKVQCGSNGTTPTAGDTIITDAVDLLINSKITNPNSIIIHFTLGSTNANGLTIAEFGTICADGTLFSRKTWTPFLKIADLSVEGTWTISRI
ncbi:MAG: hypothetical protein Q8861_01910 [Bacteroidota bacterium]|nr:hypothetical protein [Bacteroidota bacterium]